MKSVVCFFGIDTPRSSTLDACIVQYIMALTMIDE